MPPLEVAAELDDVVDHLAGSATAVGRSRCTCAAPAPSARSRRWCSSRWSRGSRRWSSSPRRYAAARSTLDLAFPFHPHVTVAHHLDDDRLDQAFAELAGFECEFEVESFHLYVHDHEVGWQPAHDFRLGHSGPG